MGIQATEERLGLRFHDRSILGVALTHRSAVNEGLAAAGTDNERLEFLGDAILGAVVAETLYREFPEAPEGTLTFMRAELVCQESLAQWARGLALGAEIVLGRGEEQRGGRDRDALLAGCFEALVGAVFLDQGYEAARGFLLPLISAEFPNLSLSPRPRDPKSELQYRSQTLLGILPAYQVLSVEGPEHRPLFTIEVRAGADIRGVGVGPSKQSAEQDAARHALNGFEFRVSSSESIEPQNPNLGARNPSLRPRSPQPESRAPNSELETRNSEPETCI
jgi:ribonuclease-3